MVNFASSLTDARNRPDDEDALSDLARSALAEQRGELALPLLRAAAERSQSALLWQWTGLLERSLDDHELSLGSFSRAAALAPGNASIAHGRARVALEAGVPSHELFEAALRLSPGNGDILIGYAASLLAAGRGEAADAMLDEKLAASPLWTDGHMQLAQLRSALGRKDDVTASLNRAIRQHPAQPTVWNALFRVLLQAQRFDELAESVNRAREHLGGNDALLQFEAIAAGELRDVTRTDHLYGSMSPALRESMAVWRTRHLLRAGRLSDALEVIDKGLKTATAPDLWPYAAAAWRLAGDARWEWLEGDLDRLVSVIDLTGQLPDIDGLEQSLRKLHQGKGEFLNQSVRGGSQTDGPLFANVDPSIRQLRSAIVNAVESHVRELPASDPGHPLLAPPRDRRTRFSGSWSVLLRDSGYHANHVHPQGWISSALYIRLPARSPDQPGTAGWLTLGQPQAELGLNLEPFRLIEPRVGTLVLFPSYMWHGTRPFSTGERLTVAFDVQRPI